MMATYLVTWEMEIEGVDTPRQAAERALEIHRDPASIATVFMVARKNDDIPEHMRATDYGMAEEVDLHGNPCDHGSPPGPISG